MFNNKCVKCGTEFETKNPKRVICPNCLYPEASVAPAKPRPQGAPGGYGPRPSGPGGPRPGGYGPRPGGPGGPRPGGGFRPGGGGRPGGGFGGPRRGPGGPRPGGRPGFGGPGRGGPRRGPGGPKKLLVSKEQLVQIEELYKQALPLPNPDIHETIGAKIDLAPSKVFFGINLIREKMKLPKLEYPKRRLAVTPDQLTAIETLYDIYMPLPPLGVHKIIAKQLKMDEWRVHVAIGLIRKNRNMNRWNEERDDIPEHMKVPKGKKPHPNQPVKAKPVEAGEAKEASEPSEKTPAEAASETAEAEPTAVPAKAPAKASAKKEASAKVPAQVVEEASETTEAPQAQEQAAGS